MNLPKKKTTKLYADTIRSLYTRFIQWDSLHDKSPKIPQTIVDNKINEKEIKSYEQFMKYIKNNNNGTNKYVKYVKILLILSILYNINYAEGEKIIKNIPNNMFIKNFLQVNGDIYLERIFEINNDFICIGDNYDKQIKFFKNELKNRILYKDRYDRRKSKKKN